MKRKRLKHLILVLEQVEKLGRKFDMGVWWAQLDHECGTSACALGWACQDPWFLSKGLHLNELKEPQFGTNRTLDAAAAFFDIDINASLELFNPTTWDIPWKDIKPQHVIDRIKNLLESETGSIYPFF